MTKRFLILLFALLALALLPAQAETDAPDALYRIVLRTEAGDETLGTGVLFGTKTMLLTAKGALADGELFAVGQDGEHAISYRGEIAGSQLMLLGLAEESAAEPMPLTTADYLMDYRLHGAQADGSLTAQDVFTSRITVLDGRAEMLLTTSADGLLPGAILLGGDGGLASLTVSQYGEGLGMYVAIADMTLTELLAAGSVSDSPQLLRGFSTEVRDGRLTIDWSAVRGAVTENTTFHVYTSIITNPYLSYDKVTGTETSSSFSAVPGTQVMVWIARSEGPLTENVLPESSEDTALVSVPAAKPFTAYGFRNLRCGVTLSEPGKDGMADDFLPQLPLTREALSDRGMSLYFQTEDAYTVTEENSEHLLLVSLHTPEGYVFNYVSGYVFMPEMNEGDLWIADITEVCETYAQFADGELWPAGEYEIVYLIDGCEAGRIPFTLD